MINILSSNEMRDVENYTMNSLGISSSVLMERAALSSFNHICSSNPKNVLIFAGNGNNGGDGIALARMLLETNIPVDLVLVGNRDKASAENNKQLSIFSNIKAAINSSSNIIYDLDSLNTSYYDVIVDALLGIGISRNLEGDYLKAVDIINNSNAYIYSLDNPTGINTDTGLVMGNAVKANETLCFSEYKLGLLLCNGPEYTGKVSVFNVGIVKSNLLENHFNNSFIHSLTKEDVDILLPKRPVTGHKGSFGKILIIGGSTKMAGAALLSSKAAFASGAGMVKLISSKINREAILSCLPELMYQSSENITNDELQKSIDWADLIVIGPGLSTDDVAKHLLIYTLENANIPVIVDADGLNILADKMHLLDTRKNKNLTTIITPHPGEYKRLFSQIILSESIINNWPESFRNDFSCNNPYYVKCLAKMYGLIIVAKNARTIISDGTDIFINLSGTNGMGTAGSGDVLTGFIASILHNSEDKAKAVALAVYLHGLAGEKAAMEKSDYSMTASDIIKLY